MGVNSLHHKCLCGSFEQVKSLNLKYFIVKQIEKNDHFFTLMRIWASDLKELSRRPGKA